MSNLDENINPPETSKNTNENELCINNKTTVIFPAQTKLAFFKSIKWVNGAWIVTPWSDAPPISE